MKYYPGDLYVTWKQKGAQERAEHVGQIVETGAESARPDVRVVATPQGRFYLAAGKPGEITEFEETVVPELARALEGAGVATNVYIEFGMKSPSGKKNATGGHVRVDHPRTPYHAISIGNEMRGSLTNALHETVHAIRQERGWDYGRETRIRMLEERNEIETCLETLAITPPAEMRRVLDAVRGGDIADVGYYGIFGPDGAADAMEYDRVLLTGAVDRMISIEEAHAKAKDRDFYDRTNIAKLPVFNYYPHRYLTPKTLTESSARRARRVVTVRASTRPRSARIAKGAGERLYEAMIGRKVVRIRAVQGKGVTKADITRYLSMRLGAKAVWECRDCRKVKVA